MLGHVLAIAEVESVIPRTVDRLLIHNPAEHWNSRSGEGCRERTRVTYDSRITRSISTQNGDMWVDVYGLVLMQAKFVDVFDFHDRVLRRSPLISEVELLGNRVAIGRVHQSACSAIN